MYLASLVLVTVSLVTYQLAQRANTAGASPWPSLLVAYMVGTVLSAIAVAATSGLDMAQIRNAPRSSLILGLAIVGIEFGYLEAHRTGWHPATVGLVGSIGATVLLAVITVMFLGERLTLRDLVGVGCCAVGLAMLVSPN